MSGRIYQIATLAQDLLAIHDEIGIRHLIAGRPNLNDRGCSQLPAALDDGADLRGELFFVQTLTLTGRYPP